MSRSSVIFISCLLTLFSTYLQAQDWKMQPVSLQTRWAKQVSPSNALPDYPRPQMVRPEWQNLNGLWNYAITTKDAAIPSNFQGNILVPYPIESALSGVKKPVLPTQNLWYEKHISIGQKLAGKRYLLHFGAVDWQATVYLNRKKLGTHTGGYDDFTFDMTDALKKGDNEILVQVFDPTDQGPNPHGKQVLNPRDIWYTATTGIWQTVWMETVADHFISDMKLAGDIDQGKILVKASITGPAGGYSLQASAMENEAPLSTTISQLHSQEGQLTLTIAYPQLWSPDHPYLYNLTLKLLDSKGRVVDAITSYYGLRKVEIKKDESGIDRIFLNHQAVFNLGVLDQGFWPDGLYTAPTDEALAFDIKTIKNMGFNTIRKHIKREPDRWYYWCDQLGMIVWQDMVNPSFDLTRAAKNEFESECHQHIEQLYNHPCITTYTLFNEKWGQYDQERLTHWIKTLDSTRLVNGHSGEYLYVDDKLRSPSPNAYIESDLTDVHSYPDPRNSLRLEGKARVLGEFGGIGVFIDGHQWNANRAWGYINVTPAQLQGKYAIMNDHLQLLKKEGLSASIYTQPFDVEGEQNGLITYDREIIKVPFAALQKIHNALVPSAGNLPSVAVTNADLTDPGIRYSGLFQQYINGKKDLGFLRDLAMKAEQVGDKTGLAQIAADYFALLRPPYPIEDARFIIHVTNSTKDLGFTLLLDSATAFDKTLDNRPAEIKVMNILFNELISASVTGDHPQPDWAALESKTAPYGALGNEILLRSKTVHYLNQKDWNQFGTAAQEYVSRYGQNLKPSELNQYAWTIFEQSDDKELLLHAAEWSKLAIAKKNDPNYLNTYSSLLYKAGKKEEAVLYEEKAVALSGDDETLATRLQKMKKGEAL